MLQQGPSFDRDRKRRQRREAARRYRQRQREGKGVYPVEGDAAIITMLVRTRWLAECDAHDRRKVAAAMGRMMKDAAKRF
jgi:hypothetical protein